MLPFGIVSFFGYFDLTGKILGAVMLLFFGIFAALVYRRGGIEKI